MKKICLPVAVLLYFFLSSSAFAQKIYLKADPFTNGGSQLDGFADYVEISSLQFGIIAPAIIGGGAGKVTLKNIIVTKNVDISSGKFMNNLARGRHIPLVEIVNVLSTTFQPQVLHKIELKNALITDISSSAVPDCPGNCPAIAESYTIIYDAIRITTYTMNENGSTTAGEPFVFNQVLGSSTF